jgi:folate-binding protein YgfZ
MLTNDVTSAPFVRAAVLNVKGRVLAIVDVVREADAFLVLSEPATAARVHEVFARHAIMDDVTFTPVELPAHRVWERPEDVWSAPPILAPPEAPSSDADVDIRRVEAGLPRYGVDVSEDHFPFEANLDTALSYTKGCYVGQEVVARAHARGHANRRLVGLRLDGAVAAGAPVSSAARPDAGAVTSCVVSPDFGPIALAYVHKSSWDPGTAVRAGERAGVVASLPFTAPSASPAA